MMLHDPHEVSKLLLLIRRKSSINSGTSLNQVRCQCKQRDQENHWDTGAADRGAGTEGNTCAGRGLPLLSELKQPKEKFKATITWTFEIFRFYLYKN